MDGTNSGHRLLAALILIASSVAACGGSTEEATAPPDSNATSSDQSPPFVRLDGKDLALGQNSSSSSATCTDQPPSPQMSKAIAWRGVGNGSEPESVFLGFFDGPDSPIVLELKLPNGEEYDTDSESTRIEVSEGPDGWHKFSGTVRRSYQGSSDTDWGDAPLLKVEGSIQCANYGAPLI